MKIHSDEKINKLKEMRKSGCSIHQIMAELNLPKTTVWHHVQGIHLTKSQKIYIRSRQGGSKIRKEKAIIEADNFAIELLNSEYREKLVIISMLYWAEGHKKSNCEFTNTDGKMISVYLKIIRSVLKIPPEKIKITIRIFTGMNKNECLSYWSSITNVSEKLIKVRFNDGGSSGRTTYGMCRVTVLKGHSSLKLMHALINKISQDVLEC